MGRDAGFSSGCDDLEVPVGHLNGIGYMILEPRGEWEFKDGTQYIILF